MLRFQLRFASTIVGRTKTFKFLLDSMKAKDASKPATTNRLSLLKRTSSQKSIEDQKQSGPSPLEVVDATVPLKTLKAKKAKKRPKAAEILLGIPGKVPEKKEKKSVLPTKAGIKALKKHFAKYQESEGDERTAAYEKYLSNLPRNKHHSDHHIECVIENSNELLSYMKAIYGNDAEPYQPRPSVDVTRRAITLIGLLYKNHPKDALELFPVISKFVENQGAPIELSLMAKVYHTIIMNARNKNDTLQMLKIMKTLKPCVTAFDTVMQDYYTKWAHLATLDIVEEIIEHSSHSIIGKVTLSPTTKNCYSMTFDKEVDLRSGTVVRLASQLEPERYFLGIMNFSNAFKNEILISDANFDCNLSYDAFDAISLSTYNAQMIALGKFVKKSSTRDSLYAQLVGTDKIERLPSHKIPSLRLNEQLNESQIEAIEGVMTQRVSLIQGPPGTGKTHTLVKLISELVNENGPGSVLVVTPTNSAVDNVMEFAIRDGLNPIRTGDPTAIRGDMAKYTLANIVYDPYNNFLAAMECLRSADLVCTTAASAGNPLFEKMRFKYVIVDEASQLTESVALIPIMVDAKRLILVGDHKQLPPNVGFWATLEGYSESLFARLSKRVDPFLLKKQYRSHPLIMDISSKLFYNDELECGVLAKDRLPPAGFKWPKSLKGEDQPVAFINVPSTEVIAKFQASKTNPGEVKEVMTVLQGFLRAGIQQNHIGVMSPYAGQNRLIRSAMNKAGIDGVEQNSVDAFQGREKEVIIFSCTRSNRVGSLGFLSDERRFNVMHTRAKRGLVVIGNKDTLKTNPTWTKWLAWVDHHKLTVPSHT